MTKGAVLAAFRKTVAEDLATLAQVTADARDEATGAESTAEGKYDTRATEASYLAAGQGRRLAALKQLATWLDQSWPPASRVGVGSLVALTRSAETRWVLVGPTGGARVTVEGTPVSLISLASPLGEELEDAEAGDEVDLVSPRGVQQWTVHAVA